MKKCRSKNNENILWQLFLFQREYFWDRTKSWALVNLATFEDYKDCSGFDAVWIFSSWTKKTFYFLKACSWDKRVWIWWNLLFKLLHVPQRHICQSHQGIFKLKGREVNFQQFFNSLSSHFVRNLCNKSRLIMALSEGFIWLYQHSIR